MTDVGMTVKISPADANDIRKFAQDHSYEPSELVRLGITVAQLLIREKELDHKFIVTNADGDIIREWIFPEPQSVMDTEARKILESTGPSTSLERAIADLDPDNPKGGIATPAPSARPAHPDPRV
jgi:hypothetical protein